MTDVLAGFTLGIAILGVVDAIFAVHMRSHHTTLDDLKEEP